MLEVPPDAVVEAGASAQAVLLVPLPVERPALHVPCLALAAPTASSATRTVTSPNTL